MTSSQQYPRQSPAAIRPQRSGQTCGNTSSSNQECPQRSMEQRSRGRQRQAPNGTVEELSCPAYQEEQPRIRSRPQHHLHSESSKDAAQLFEFFYQVIFSLVHIALTAVLAPVLGTKRKDCGMEASVRRSGSRDQLSPPPSAMEDPESGISVGSGSSNGSYQPILKTTHSTRRCSDISPEKKSLRFAAPERSRPPLGRIGLSSSSSTISTCSSSSSLSRPSSSGSESSYSKRDRFRGAVATRSGSTRRPSSPLGRLAGPRMNHSAYFLE